MYKDEESIIMHEGRTAEIVNYLADKIENGVKMSVKIEHYDYTKKEHKLIDMWGGLYAMRGNYDGLLEHLFDCDTMGYTVMNAKSMWKEDKGEFLVRVNLERFAA